MRQKRMLLRLRLGDQRAAMAVGGCEEAPGHVVAEKRNCRGVTPVRHCESAAGAGAVLSIGERRLCDDGNAGFRRYGPVIEYVAGEGGDGDVVKSDANAD